MDKKTALLLAVLVIMLFKCLLPPAEGLRRQAAELLGYKESWIQALAQGKTKDGADRRAASAGQ